jgi:GNAT superfamily N-acetyltransferase
MTGITARPLGPDDQAEWAPLWEAYLAFYGTTLPPGMFEVQFARLLAGDPFFGLAAEAEGRLVGICHCILHGHGWRPERVVYLQDLFVGEAARGLGAGRALIEAVYAEADRRGAPYVYWLTQDSNATARQLYDRVARHTPFTRYVRPL